MANILFLAHRIPYPPNKGDKIRSWNFLSRLAANHKVHLGFFVDNKRDMEHVGTLEALTSSLCYTEVSSIGQKLLSLRAFFSGKSLTEMAYPYKKLRHYARSVHEREPLDAIFVFSAAAAPIASAVEGVPVICDLVDVDSEKWRAYSTRAFWPLSWLYRREAEKLRKFEAALAKTSKACLCVSNEEATLFRKIHPSLADRVAAIPNGVDVRIFDPSLFAKPLEGKHLMFSGAMDYQPNVDAVTWFCKDVLPLVQERHPDVEFTIAGGPAASAVRQLARLPGVQVLGYVDDMAATLATANVCVAPLQIARGTQNKVLEAMAMGKPVIATSLANEGINARDGEQLLVADTAEDFAAAIDRLMVDRDMSEKLGKEARKFVTEEFSWSHAFDELNRFFTDA